MSLIYERVTQIFEVCNVDSGSLGRVNAGGPRVNLLTGPKSLLCLIRRN